MLGCSVSSRFDVVVFWCLGAVPAVDARSKTEMKRPEGARVRPVFGCGGSKPLILG